MLKKVIVTGGGGFLGFAVIKHIQKEFKNAEIVSISRNFYQELEKKGVKQIEADISKQDDIKESFFEKQDLVFHIAAKAGVWGDYDDYYAINFLGTKYIADICLKKNIPLVYTSSPSVVFSGEDMEGVDESVSYPEKPEKREKSEKTKKFLSHYSKTKALAEQYILKLCKEGLRAIILRPHLIWGPLDNHLVPKILKRSNKLFKIKNRRNLVDTIYIDNAAYGHILSAKKIIQDGSSSGKIYFLSQDEPIYVFDMIDGILKAGGKDRVKKEAPYFLVYFAAFLIEKIYKLFRIKKEPLITRFIVKELSSSHWFDISHAKKDLGYTPLVSTKKGLEELKNHLQKGKF